MMNENQNDVHFFFGFSRNYWSQKSAPEQISERRALRRCFESTIEADSTRELYRAVEWFHVHDNATAFFLNARQTILGPKVGDRHSTPALLATPAPPHFFEH
jgi:hypothetical protein